MDTLSLSDEALLAQCDVHIHRTGGPGGQKRNKTSTAVRLHHRPSNLTVVASESRSQNTNRLKALRRLREAIALEVRHPVSLDSASPPAALCDGIGPDGRLRIGRRDPRYLPAVQVALDILAATHGEVARAAAFIGITTGNLSGFLTDEPKVLAIVNRIRHTNGLHPLRR